MPVVVIVYRSQNEYQTDELFSLPEVLISHLVKYEKKLVTYHNEYNVYILNYLFLLR